MIYTEEQEIAIKATHKKICLVAGPGSGKTTTLVGRIRRLIDEGVNPRQIGCLTFTRKAAENLMSKLQCKIGVCGTLHSYLLSEINELMKRMTLPAMRVIPSEFEESLMVEVMGNLKLKASMKKLFETKRHQIKRIKGSDIDKILNQYSARLTASGYIDSDLIIQHSIESIKFSPRFGRLKLGHGFEHLMIDEYQDSSELDEFIYQELTNNGTVKNIFVVGDPKQSAYEFRGAKPENMNRDSSWVTLELKNNFRSSKRVCEVANRIFEEGTRHSNIAMGNGKYRFGSITPQDSAKVISEELQITLKKKQSSVVICRTNRMVKLMAKSLEGCGVTSKQVIDERPKDSVLLTSFVMHYCEPNNNVLKSIFLYHLKKHKIQYNTIEMNRSFIRASQFLSLESRWYLDEALSVEGSVMENGMINAEKVISILNDILNGLISVGKGDIEILTVHAAKGGEWDNVYVVGIDEGQFPASTKEERIREELRLLYIAVTRSKQNLTCIQTGFTFDHRGELSPANQSPFREYLNYETEV